MTSFNELLWAGLPFAALALSSLINRCPNRMLNPERKCVGIVWLHKEIGPTMINITRDHIKTMTPPDKIAFVLEANSERAGSHWNRIVMLTTSQSPGLSVLQA